MAEQRIDLDLDLPVPADRAWDLITAPGHLRAWYAFDGAEIDPRPGGAMRLHWAEHGTHLGTVEAADPPHRLVFRWALRPDRAPADGNATRVEITLTSDRGGTRLHLAETGFAGLDGTDADRAAHHADNTAGWTAGLAALRDLAG